MTKKRFLFDLDGTILNTWQDLASAMNAALAQEGLPVFLPENYRLWVGSGVFRLAQYLLAVEVPKALATKGLNAAVNLSAEELVRGFMTAYDRCCLEKSQPYPQILDFLHELQKSGQELAVLTNKPAVFASRLVNHFFPGLFAVVVGMRPEYQPKPAMDLYHLLKAQFPAGLNDSSCVMIGDSEADVRMGKQIPCPTIAVSWGFRSGAVLKAEEPDFLVDDVNALARCCFDLLK